MRTRIVGKLAAAGAAATMLGATLAGAFAYTLADYPAPFIQNGQFNGYFVVGETAKAVDVIGMVDIATSLQAEAVQKVPVQVPGQEAETTVEGGAKVEQGTDKLNLMESFSSVKSFFGGDDLSVLKKVTWEDGSGNTYNVEFRVVPGTGVQVRYSGDVNDVEVPVLAIDWTQTNADYTLVVDFQDPVNFTALAGQSVTLFGQEFTVAEANQLTDDSKLVLYKAAVDQVFEPGQEETVQVGDRSVTVEVVNANSDKSEAIIKVNGEQRTVKAGESYTIGGEKVYVKDVFIGNVLNPYAAVRLLIGADKIVLQDGQPVRMGTDEEAMGGTTVTISKSAGKATKIEVKVEPDNLPQEMAVEGTELGQEFVDPVFGAVKWVFADAIPALDSSERDEIKVYPSSSDRLNLKFTNRRGDVYDIVLLREVSGTPVFQYGTATSEAYVLQDNADTNAAGDGTNDARRIVKDNRFVVKNGEYSRILELTFVDHANHEITLKDVGSGDTQTWKATTPVNDTEGTAGSGFNGEAADKDYDGDGTFEADSSTYHGVFTYDGKDYDFYIDDDADAITIDAAEDTTTDTYATLITKGGAQVDILPGWTSGTDLVRVTEETQYNNDDPEFDGRVDVEVSYSATRSKKIYVSNIAFTAVTPGSSWSGLQSEDNSDKNHFLTQYGTYGVWDSGESAGYVNIYYPSESMYFNVFLAPTSAAAQQTGGEGTVYSEKVNKISAGAAIFDTDAADMVGQENLIVVGGPCANSVAASLLGVTGDNCAEGFEPGKAIIQLFNHDSGKVSLLVAGYSGSDTRLAAQVLANYEQFKSQLKGTKVIVSGTSLQTVQITQPQAESQAGNQTSQ